MFELCASDNDKANGSASISHRLLLSEIGNRRISASTVAATDADQALGDTHWRNYVLEDPGFGPVEEDFKRKAAAGDAEAQIKIAALVAQLLPIELARRASYFVTLDRKLTEWAAAGGICADFSFSIPRDTGGYIKMSVMGLASMFV